jgi:nitroreductase
MTREEAVARSAVDTDQSAGLARLLSERFSCRAFRPDPVPRPVIERMLGIAQLTASWCNSQAWQLIVTEGAGTEKFREALFAHAFSQPPGSAAQFDFPGPQYSGIYLERRREVGWQLYDSVGGASGSREFPSVRRAACRDHFRGSRSRRLRCDRLRRLCDELRPRGAKPRSSLYRAGRHSASFAFRASSLQAAGAAPRGVRHLVRVSGRNSRGESIQDAPRRDRSGSRLDVGVIPDSAHPLPPPR